ncbi:HLA class I histocompatibility antigen, alpha chain E-like [Astyanax mexicanus]|uniref:HLA class I histocompatibility antigen, alpha chain E-like n=1 Tax=Astyanax mexicanus TaxID=7994 RepID=UPI0020CAA0BB|nr:HLA class I histocompatibility antigen, alpha chain E-like [Astyanax mexicanus]
MMMRSIIALLLFSFLLIVTGDKHSLLYLYTIQSINSDSHLYDCTAVTLLNDRQIDFYSSSSDKPRTAKQNWLKNISESDWKTSTEKLQCDTQLLNRLLDIQMSEFGHSHSGVHVLQWRHGCEQSSDGSLTVLNSINEFGYDGEDLIQFNCTSKTWITPEEKKNREREEEKNREREEKNREREEKKNREREKKKNREREEEWNSGKLILTCLITGFYPKDVKMSLRKFNTSLPDHLITSSGVRTNHNRTYQLRKSVEIQEDEKDQYECYVNHSSLTEPVIKKWAGNSETPVTETSTSVLVVVAVVIMVLCSGIFCFLIMKRRNRTGSDSVSPSASSDSDSVLKDSADAGSPASSPLCNGDIILVHYTSPGPDSTLPCQRTPDLPINQPCPVKPVHMIVKFLSGFIKAGISLESTVQDSDQDQD